VPDPRQLDPRLKRQYFDRNWKKSWIDKAETNFKRLVQDYTRQFNLATPERTETSASAAPRTVLSNWKYKENVGKANKDIDELKEYFKLPLEDEDVSPRQWWVANQYKFPVLLAMAHDFLSIPAMSAEVERVFSGCVPTLMLLMTMQNS
jgi:hypothetical protein